MTRDLYRDREEVVRQNVTGRDNPFSPFALGVDRDDKRVMDGEKSCNFTADGTRFYPKDMTKLARDGLFHWERAPNPSCGRNGIPCFNDKHCVPNNLYCPGQLGIAIWDYGARDVYQQPAREGGIGNCAAIPDYSRFALDKTQQATITLQLTGTNTGIAFYDSIDANGLGPLSEIITAGNRSIGAVFPKADFSGKGVTSFEMAAQMPQDDFRPGLDGQVENREAAIGPPSGPAVGVGDPKAGHRRVGPDR